MFAEEKDPIPISKSEIPAESCKRQEKEEKSHPKIAKNVEDPVSIDFASWPISELKRFLTEHHVDCSTVVEKTELIHLAKEAEKSSLRASTYRAPEGFVYHSESGYFYNEEQGLYYDGASCCFYDPRTTKWYDSEWKELKSS